MALSPILSVVQTVIIGIMLNLSSGNNEHGLQKRYM